MSAAPWRTAAILAGVACLIAVAVLAFLILGDANDPLTGTPWSPAQFREVERLLEDLARGERDNAELILRLAERVSDLERRR